MIDWAVGTVVFKACLYLCTAAGIGAFLVHWLMRVTESTPTLRWLPGAGGAITISTFGLFVSVCYFFIRVGEYAESGLSGMLDPVFGQILWDSPVGRALQVRLAAFSLLPIGLVALSMLVPRRHPLLWSIALLLGLSGSVIAAASFSLTGHSANHGLLANVAITLHALTALAWAGSLYPLMCATGRLTPPVLQRVLRRYSMLAGWFVALLFTAGIGLLVMFYQSSAGEVSCAYIGVLAVKLLLVAGLLLVAAHHKWRAVHRITHPDGIVSFRRSLGLEIVLASLILCVTAVLSTLLGPVHAS